MGFHQPCARGLKNENRGEKLWVPANTQAQADKRFVDSYFGSEVGGLHKS
jgi:hypothetical protein